MVINRRTFIPKRGCGDQLLALFKAERERTGNFRILTPIYGPFDVVVCEFETADQAELDKNWAEWGQDPLSQTFMEKFMALTENGGSNELWELL